MPFSGIFIEGARNVVSTEVFNASSTRGKSPKMPPSLGWGPPASRESVTSRLPLVRDIGVVLVVSHTPALPTLAGTSLPRLGSFHIGLLNVSERGSRCLLLMHVSRGPP